VGRRPRYIQTVLELLKTGRAYTAKEIASLTGFSPSAVYNALRTLIIQQKVHKSALWRAKYMYVNSFKEVEH